VRYSICPLVVFDDDETCYEEVQSQVVGNEMGNGALALLSRGMCGLQNEDGFCEEKQAS